MSIKKLFDNRKPNNETLSSDSYYTGSKDIESIEYAKTKEQEFDRFEPHVDYSSASNFAKYGSAEMYYESSFKRIYQQYPYDGSRKEKTEFQLSSSYLDKYIFDNLYPRTNGYVTMGRGGLAGTDHFNIKNPNVVEYIYFQGGPHTASAGMTTNTVASTFSGSNIYKVSTRQASALEYTAASGSTIEFWMKKKPGSYIAYDDEQIIFDLWNQEYVATTHLTTYGRMQLWVTDQSSITTSPFQLTLKSGSDGFHQGMYLCIDNAGNSTLDKTAVFDGNWHHYAVSLLSQSDGTRVRFYVDGNLNNERKVDGVGDIRGLSGGSNAALGGMISDVFPASLVYITGSGKFSGSLDEFRYWKVERTGREIKNNFFIPIGGGTNKLDSVDEANLGVYFKFNEGITGDASLDSTVLDYSGRITNGAWTGYAAGARNTGSALVLSGKAKSEFKDPIIYSSDPLVSSSMAEYKASGSHIDLENTSLFYHLLPSWAIEEDTNEGETVKTLCQIMASYFDTLHAQVSASLYIHDESYPSASYKPYPFADRLLRNRGFVVPETFIDATIIEKFLQKDDRMTFEKSLDEVKKLIYHNIYNNLLYIYKSKGTEKSFRNLLRCYGIDTELIKLNLYADDVTFTFQNNYENTSVEKRFIDFNQTASFGGSVYQTASVGTTNEARSMDIYSLTYVEDSVSSSFTYEAEIVFPKKLAQNESGYFRTPFISSSLFGYHKVITEAASGFGGGADPWSWSPDDYSFQAYFIKEDYDSLGGRFVLSGSRLSSVTEISSSHYANVYDNSKWNLAIRIKDNTYPLNDGVSGLIPDRVVEFYGVNVIGNTVINEFVVSASIEGANAHFYTYPAWKIYGGAHRENYTGSLIQSSDVKISSLRWWQSYLDNDTIKVHAYDPTNAGVKYPLRIDNLFQNLDGDNDSSTAPQWQVPQIKTLALNWEFSLVTGSNDVGKFIIADVSSGSIDGVGGNYIYGPWMGDVITPIHIGEGRFFATSSAQCVDKDYIFASKQRLPEVVYSSDMVSIETDEKRFFFQDPNVTDNFYSFEKSMNAAISSKMLNMFATVVDFNNLVGEPVNRYREDYKNIAALKQLFFQNVENEPDFEKFTSFYKWIDVSVSQAITQLFPASARFSEGVRNVVESHILERNKYANKLPLVSKVESTEGIIKGSGELLYNWQYGHAPVFTKAKVTLTCTDYPTNTNTFSLTDTSGNSVTFVCDSSVTTADGSKNGDGHVIIGTLGGGLTLPLLVARMVTAINGQSDVRITASSQTVYLTLIQDKEGPNGNTIIDMSGYVGFSSANFVGGFGFGEKENCLWQKERRERSGSAQEALRQVIVNETNAGAPILTQPDGTAYYGSSYALRKLSSLGALKTKFTKNLHGGINYSKNKDRMYYRIWTAPAGKTGTAANVPQNVMAVGLLTGSTKSGEGLYGFVDCIDSNVVDQKRKWDFEVLNGAAPEDSYNRNLSGAQKWPFNFVSGTISTGYNTYISSSFDSNVVAVNVHSDTFTTTNEIGMQGPFTEAWVGGLEARHVRVNRYDAAATTRAPYSRITTLGSKAWASITLEYADLAGDAGSGDYFTLKDYEGTSKDFYLTGSTTHTGFPAAAYPVNTGSNAVLAPTDPSKQFLAGWQAALIESGLKIEATTWTYSAPDSTLVFYQKANSYESANATPAETSPSAISYTVAIFAGHPGADDVLSTVYAQTDDDSNRPEAYGILAGETDGDGAIGLVAADYGGVSPNPNKVKAYWFRDVQTKRPINIANIKYGSSSALAGNYRHNYEIVNTVGRTTNNLGLRAHRDVTAANLNQYLPNLFSDSLPLTTNPYTLVSQTPVTIMGVPKKGNVFGVYPNNRQNSDNIFSKPSSSLEDGTHNNTVIASQFSAPGGFETSNGYLDTYAKEFSAYNALPWRNLTVRSKGSGEAGTVRVTDQLGYRRGLSQLLQRHCGKFGLDSEYGSPENVLLKGTSGAGGGTSYIRCGAETWETIIGSGAGGTKKVTVSTWINIKDTNSYIMTWGITIQLAYNQTDNSISWIITYNGGGSRNWKTVPVITENTWHHVAVIHSLENAGASTSDPPIPVIYVDGVAVNIATTTDTGSPGGNALGAMTIPLYIGIDGSGGTFPLKGKIDEVAVWNKLLTATDITKIYNAGRADSLYATGLDSDVQGWWRMGENTDCNKIIEDMSGNGNAGEGYNIYLEFMDENAGSFQKVNRNVRRKLAQAFDIDGGTSSPKFNYDYDNGYVSHPIPRSDYQYSWINDTLGYNYNVYSGQQIMFGHAARSGESTTESRFLYNTSALAANLLASPAADDYVAMGTIGKNWTAGQTIAGWYRFSSLGALFRDRRDSEDPSEVPGFEGKYMSFGGTNNLRLVVPYYQALVGGGSPSEDIWNFVGLDTAIAALGLTMGTDWVHLAFSHDGVSGSAPKFYLNGVSKTMAQITTNVSASEIAYKSRFNIEVIKAVHGSYDELSLWGSQLSDDHILNLYNQAPPFGDTNFPTKDLVGWWRFGDTRSIYNLGYSTVDTTGSVAKAYFDFSAMEDLVGDYSTRGSYLALTDLKGITKNFYFTGSAVGSDFPAGGIQVQTGSGDLPADALTLSSNLKTAVEANMSGITVYVAAYIPFGTSWRVSWKFHQNHSGLSAPHAAGATPVFYDATAGSIDTSATTFEDITDSNYPDGTNIRIYDRHHNYDLSVDINSDDNPAFVTTVGNQITSSVRTISYRPAITFPSASEITGV
tara:strand:- start:15068 stop:23215 length:8148 start_codon:yes stop_codon:yes gene_type:complete